jgi:hypothetical protein
VLEKAQLCSQSQWRSATEGEAYLILGDIDKGFSAYTHAIAGARSQREIDSMYGQAFRIAERVYGENGLERLEGTFNPGRM